MSNVAAQLAKLQAMKVAKPQVKPTTTASTVKGTIPAKKGTTPLAKGTTSKVVSSASSGKELGALLNQVNNLQDKAVSQVAAHEAAGLYDLADTTELEGFDGDAFISTLRNLDAATVEKSPDIRRFSRMIRTNLEQYPELTHILTDEQLGIITSGVLTLANVNTAPKTAAAATKAANIKAKDLASMDINDLFGGMA